MTIKKTVTSKPRKKKSDSPNAVGPEQNEASLHEYQAILAMAEEVAQIGSWKWDLRTQKVTWSEEMFRLFGVEREGFDGDINRIVAERIHPEDVAAVAESNRKVLEEADPIPLSYRIVLPDGTERTVWAQGKLIRDQAGQPQALTGFVQDITERVRAEKKIEQMKRLYATLSQVNQMIVRVKGQNELFQTICDVAVQFGEFSLAWVGLLDEATGDIRPVAAIGVDVKQWPFPIVNMQNGEYQNSLTSTAIRTSKVVTSENIAADQRTQHFSENYKTYHYHAVAAIPFKVRGKTIGALALASHDAGLFKDADEIKLLEEMGMDISFALDTMETEKARRQAEKKVEQQNQRLEILHTIDMAILAADSLDNIADAALNNIHELMKCRRSTVTLFDWERNEALVFNVKTAGETPIPQGTRIPVARFQEMNQTLSKNQHVLINDLRVLADPPPPIQSIIREGFCSLCILPLFSQGSLIGMLSLSSEIPGFFDNEKINLGREIASQVTIAITQKRLTEGLKESEQKFSLLFNKAPFAISLARLPGGVIVEVNDEFEKLVGYSREEILGKTSLDLNLYPEPATRARMAAEFQARGFTRDAELAFRTKSGDIRHLTINTDLLEIAGEQHVLTTAQDVTERLRADKALRESEERLRLSLLAANQGLYDLNVQTGDTIVNRQYAEMLGYDFETFVETNAFWIERLHPDDQEITTKAYSDYTNGLLPEYRVEFRQRTKDGNWKWILSLGKVIEHDAQGNPLRMLGTHTDITERKQTEEKLQKSQETYQQLFESNPHPMWVYDLETLAFLMVNDAAMEHYGYSREEFLKMTIKDIRPKEELPALLNNLAQKNQLLEKSTGWRHHKKDGTLIDVEITSHAIQFEGRTARLVMANDITERKQSEEQIKQSEAVLRLFVEHSPASIAMFDRDMKYIVASNRYLTDYHLPLQDITGRSHYDVFPEMPERWKEIHRRCLAGAIEKAEEDPFPRENGTLDWVRWEIRPWYEEAGVIGGIILFSEVITERKQVQDELRLLNAQLEQRVLERTAELQQANRAKDEFLANMSHELRTPLNTVLGLSETLLEQRRGPLNEKQSQALELISSSGRHLLSLINDILEVSKIEAGKLQLYSTTVSVKELCESSLNFIKEMAVKKRIDTEYLNEDGISELNADPQRLKQILINLLMNAVKFTPDHGKVSLKVFTNAEKDQILFSVTDTGIGIAQDDLKKLFTPFTQLDGSLARQYAGTGLGLALVQKLTDLHGGSVHVESEPGKGSRFTICLPWKASASDPTSFPVPIAARPAYKEQVNEPLEESHDHGVILLAEDNEANIVTMGEYLEAYGYEVQVAHDGFEAIEKAKTINPDLILMDIQMPAMDGLEAMRLLRQDARFAATPIIALTALAMPGDRERCLSAGADEYMSKPVSLKELAKTIAQMLEQKKKQ